MQTPFDDPGKETKEKVIINDRTYTGKEIAAYFDDVLEQLSSGLRSSWNRVQYTLAAHILINQKEYSKALALLYRGLQLYKYEPHMIYLTIHVLIKQKNFAEADRIAKEYLNDNPGDFCIKLTESKIKRVEGDFKAEEISLLQLIITPGSDYLDNRFKMAAYQRLANIYMKSGRFEQAEAMVEKLMRRDLDESVWSMYFDILHNLNRKDSLDKAKNDFARYRRACIYFEQGTEYEIAGKFSLALSNYRKGLEIYDKDSTVNIKTGNILLYRKRWYSKAETYIRRAVELDPEQENYLTTLILCLRNQGKYTEAFEYAKKVIAMNPQSETGIFRILAKKIDRTNEFVAIANQTIENDKQNLFPKIRFELAELLDERGDADKALQYYRQALEIWFKQARNFPDDWELYFNIGKCYLKLGKDAEAEASFRNAEKLRGCNLPEIYIELIELYRKTHQPHKLIPYLRKIIRLNPVDLINYVDLGINYASLLTANLRQKESKKKWDKHI
ncbi:MAG: tetratricopeptide repeat protein [Firmicutes bacterium]|nr:tetratricopeptide repeat protein [Bacillota bacterium]